MLLADYRIVASLSVVFVVVAILKHKYADAGTAATSLWILKTTVRDLHVSISRDKGQGAS